MTGPATVPNVIPQGKGQHPACQPVPDTGAQQWVEQAGVSILMAWVLHDLSRNPLCSPLGFAHLPLCWCHSRGLSLCTSQTFKVLGEQCSGQREQQSSRKDSKWERTWRFSRGPKRSELARGQQELRLQTKAELVARGRRVEVYSENSDQRMEGFKQGSNIRFVI